jgi:hypothetical protein
MAKVLKVVISVVAPEKSIVPWAWATLVRERARRVGAIVRMAGRRLAFREGFVRAIADTRGDRF